MPNEKIIIILYFYYIFIINSLKKLLISLHGICIQLYNVSSKSLIELEDYQD